MGILKTSCAQIAGISCTFPAQEISTNSVAHRLGISAKRLIAVTGIESRRVAPAGICASDLCHNAAERLLKKLEWPKNSVSALIFLSQTPDFILPATACLLQHRLGLSKSCMSFDINMGCSGYIYGLMVAASLVQCGLDRVMLLVGDTINRICSNEDKSVASLFGDAGSATAIQKGESNFTFLAETDGSGAEHLIVPAGQSRQRVTASLCQRQVDQNGNIRSAQELYMNGAEVFEFANREVPVLFERLQHESGYHKDDFDAVVMHQANQFMLDSLGRKLGISKARTLSSVRMFGNTSCASIPVTISMCLHNKPQNKTFKIAMLGFGVGWSWAACAADIGATKILDPEFI
jgi:3-oxoacyl-[acyl-carrier-protein] synthase-3